MVHFTREYTIQESHGIVKADSEAAIKAGIDRLIAERLRIEKYARKYPEFLTALDPQEAFTGDRVIREMCSCSAKFGVGPMASVAGVLADLMAESIERSGGNFILVENGGEIFLRSTEPVVVQLGAGTTPVGNKYAFRVVETPVGIGSSSARISHALSFGEADLVTVIADNAGLADAAATRICNEVQGSNVAQSIEGAMAVARDFPEIHGVLIVREDQVGMEGNLPELVRVVY